MKQELIKPIVKLGNGAGVVLPKEWLGGEARVQVSKKPLNLKEDIIKMLKPYFKDLIGIYLVGSYARGEQNKNSDIDVIAISSKTKKEIVSGKYHISIYKLESAEKTLNKHPIMIYPRLIEAKTILNEILLEKLKSTKISKEKFKIFFGETKRIIKIDREFLELDKLDGDYLASTTVIYSLILRLRGIFIIESILNKKKYSNRLFKKWLTKIVSNRELEKIYKIYQSIKDNKGLKIKIRISVAEKLLNFLEKKVGGYYEKKKTASQRN